MFVSHAWSNPLIGGNAFTTLYAIKHPYKSHSAVEFVWLDVACYNQHRVEVVAADMKAVISSIGRIALPMINAAPFGRLWCLWELLCAHVGGAAVDLWEANGSAYDIGFSARRFTEDFVSVERAGTSLATDREQILARRDGCDVWLDSRGWRAPSPPGLVQSVHRCGQALESTTVRWAA
jgi:hypothetical protein